MRGEEWSKLYNVRREKTSEGRVSLGSKKNAKKDSNEDRRDGLGRNY